MHLSEPTPEPAAARAAPRRLTVVLVGVVAAALIVAGGWLVVETRLDRAAASGTFLAAVPALDLRATPPDGALDVRPDASVNVTARNGRIVAATLLDEANQATPGTLAADGSAWSTGGAGLAPGTHYRVALEVETTRGKRTRTMAFTTLTPTATVSARVSPGDDETVGVGQPLSVKFSDPVTNKAAVERRLVVHASVPIVGAWHWFSDTEARFRPQDYWPAHAQVELAANLAGVDTGDGRWGERNVTTKFAIGDANVSTVDLQSHRMVVTKNGQQIADIPQSAGKTGFPTMTGTLIVLNKAAEVVMDSTTNGIALDAPEGYRTTVQWATRVTNTGIYVHAAPWSVGSQGSANVSHGCVNVSDEWGKWFYDLSQPGDVVRIIGGPRAPSATDAGSRDWNMSWADWVAGSTAGGLPIS